MIIKNGLVFRGKRGFIEDTLYIQDGRFTETADGEIIDAAGCYVIPGLVDIHFHGAAGYDLCDASAQAIAAIAEYERANGVTSICPATMTLEADHLARICQSAAQYREEHDTTQRRCEHGSQETGCPAAFSESPRGARLVGIHLEGPFINPDKKGAQNPAYILPPSIELLDALLEESQGLVKLITVAPEIAPAMTFIPEAVRRGVHVSIGHTACDYETASRAIALGADHLTHTCNAMSLLSHRAPGPIAAGYMADSVMAEVICDGIHVHPAMVKGLLRLFGEDRVVFISDSMRAAGMPDGDYDLGGLGVHVSGPCARLADGTIAGSVSNLMQCVRVAVSMGIPLETAVACATVNPARSIGIQRQVGSLDIEKYADCVLLDRDTLEIRRVLS